MKTHRLARVSEVIREVAAETILFQIRDPRVKHTTVTRVETAGDLQHAKVYVSIMGSEAQQAKGVVALQNAAGFIQSKLAKRLATRFLPTLSFHLDEGIKKSIEVARILMEEKRRSGELLPLPDGVADDGTGLTPRDRYVPAEDADFDDDDSEDDDEDVEIADGSPAVATAAAIDEAGPRDSDEQTGTTGTATPKS
jgi:ribosome-binding factor A